MNKVKHYILVTCILFTGSSLFGEFPAYCCPASVTVVPDRSKDISTNYTSHGVSQRRC